MQTQIPPNNLIHEKSPYLRQHAYQPVQWFAWGTDAFGAARRLDRPILLSIGYATCHWCHVMARESFDDPEVARIMNDNFVNIKLDREERPDVDAIYINAVSALTGSAGWPLNVFLTPDLKPFFGGTYFPPHAGRGMASWPDVLRAVSRAWQDPQKRRQMTATAQQLKSHLASLVGGGHPHERSQVAPDTTAKVVEALAADFDTKWGGFGRAPKFPMPPLLTFLLRVGFGAEPSPSIRDKAREMALLTLDKMAAGGIYDPLGGGFHRYATDGKWHVPHFEKMLYDNAQLAQLYTLAFTLTQKSDYAAAARETLDYLRRDLGQDQGGFYAAEDADSLPPNHLSEGMDSKPLKKEGAFYVWSAAEIHETLEENRALVFNHCMGVREEGNVSVDPHGEFPGQNVLFTAKTCEQTAAELGLDPALVTRDLTEARRKLFEHREKRHRPFLDRKIVTAWNALAISAFAQGYRVFRDPADLKIARAAAGFLEKHLYNTATKSLYRRWIDAEAKFPGLADDYAALANALVDLFLADYDPHWLDWAVDLGTQLVERFSDEAGGFFLTAPDQDESLIMRVKDDVDGVLPSASSMGALALLRLSGLSELHREEFSKAAQNTVAALLGRPARARSVPFLLHAANLAPYASEHAIICGAKTDPRAQALLETALARSRGVLNVVWVHQDYQQAALSRHMPYIAELPLSPGKPAAYVCRHHTCQAPVSAPDELAALLDRSRA